MWDSSSRAHVGLRGSRCALCARISRPVQGPSEKWVTVSAAFLPDRTAPSIVAGRPVSVQSPARTRFRQGVRAGGRRRVCSGVWANVARFSLTTRKGGISVPPRLNTCEISAQMRSAISSGGPSTASAALTVTETTSCRQNSHCAMPPTSPTIDGPAGGAPAIRKWTLRMARNSQGTTRSGSSEPQTPAGTARTTESSSPTGNSAIAQVGCGHRSSSIRAPGHAATKGPRPHGPSN